MSLAAGTKLGTFEIIGLLGVGGMGEVYRARDTKLGREVAIKVLPEDVANEDRLKRFAREAKILASINHPNIAGIHDVDQDGGVSFLALELVPGEDLAERLARGPLSIPEALDVALQIAAALEDAHAGAIVHRDLKPANVKVSSSGKVKVLDFGLAKALSDDRRSAVSSDDAPTVTANLTRGGAILGTTALYEPGTGAWTGDRCAERHLVVRLLAVGVLDWRKTLWGRDAI